jgi:hypothetical protein
MDLAEILVFWRFFYILLLVSNKNFNTMNTKVQILVMLALILGAKTYGQEWEHTHEYAYSDTCVFSYSEASEMNNGNIAVASTMAYKSGVGDFYSLQPGVAIIKPAQIPYCEQQSYFKPGFYTSNIPYVFEKNDTLFLLTTYTPDHDFTYFNYHRNYEEQHDYAILGLYKLDNHLDITNSFETRMPIDTFELRDNHDWQAMPNDYSGSLFLFSALQDDNAIVGAYVKRYSMGHYANDSMFFFRMDYQGQVLDKVGYRMKSTSSSLSRTLFLRTHHMVRNGNGFIFFDLSNNLYLSGKEETDFESEGYALYLDHNFNPIKVKAFRHYNQPHSSFYDMSVVRTPWGTNLVSTEYYDASQSSSGISSCALYEYDDGRDSKSGYLNMLHHLQRYQFNRMDRTPSLGVDVCPIDWTIYYGYTLNTVTNSTDSWMIIEHLYAHFDTIRTLYYDHEGERVRSFMSSITATRDGGCIIVYGAKNLDQTNQRWSCVTKFPPEAFVGIDEAHDNGLKVAIAYPNPGKDLLNIRTGLKDAHVEIYDLTGKLIYKQEITGEITAINAESWPSGTYLWKVVENGKEAETGKWMKE